MSKCSRHAKGSRKANAEELFFRAAKHHEEGRVRLAFRLYLKAAKAGDRGCQLNVGYCYDEGIGVRRNRSAALYWYKRAYRRGDASAASNIGVMWRNEKKPRRALEWFQKAVRLGDAEANLQIAKLYILNEQDLDKALSHLEKVCAATHVTEAGMEEAAQLLKQTRKRLRLKHVWVVKSATDKNYRRMSSS